MTTPIPPTLSDLVERLRKAEGPDKELDLALAQAVVLDVLVLRHNRDTGANEPHVYWEYTRSVDDALALVERLLPGCWWVLAKGRLTEAEPLYACELLRQASHDDQIAISEGATLPLAILAALLSALQSSGAGE